MSRLPQERVNLKASHKFQTFGRHSTRCHIHSSTSTFISCKFSRTKVVRFWWPLVGQFMEFLLRGMVTYCMLTLNPKIFLLHPKKKKTLWSICSPCFHVCVDLQEPRGIPRRTFASTSMSYTPIPIITKEPIFPFHSLFTM